MKLKELFHIISCSVVLCGSCLMSRKELEHETLAVTVLDHDAGTSLGAAEGFQCKSGAETIPAWL